MIIECLVEDRSTKTLFDALLPRIAAGSTVEFRTNTYHLRKHPNLKASSQKAHIKPAFKFSENLRQFTPSSLWHSIDGLIVHADADDSDCRALKQSILSILGQNDAPLDKCLVRIAIEETEAWLLGDSEAIKRAYPKANTRLLTKHQPDAICGTWELLAKVIDPRSANMRYPEAGFAKSQWAEAIAPYMNIEENQSPSFQAFRDGVRRLVATLTAPDAPKRR